MFHSAFHATNFPGTAQTACIARVTPASPPILVCSAINLEVLRRLYQKTLLKDLKMKLLFLRKVEGRMGCKENIFYLKISNPLLTWDISGSGFLISLIPSDKGCKREREREKIGLCFFSCITRNRIPQKIILPLLPLRSADK